MNLVLLDTNVVSELMRPRPDARVVRFVEQLEGALISVATLHELVEGAERLSDPVRRADLNNWIDRIEQRYAAGIVGIDAHIARLSGTLRGAAERRGRIVTPMDALIAGCALSRGATLATRNTRDFQTLGVALVNPWAEA